MAKVKPLKPEQKPKRRSVSDQARVTRPSTGGGSHAAPGSHGGPGGPGPDFDGDRGGISRRHFVVGGTVAAAAVAATGVTLGIRSHKKKNEMEDDFTGITAEDEKFSPLKPTADQIDDVFDFGEIETNGVVSQINSFDVPINCVITANESLYATALVPANSRETLVHIARIGLLSGNMETVLEKAVSADEGYEIYDARSNDEVMVWVETEIVSGNWRVYMGEMNEFLLGEPRLLDEGDGLYDPPWICVCKDAAVWAVMPDAKGEASDQDTLVKVCTYNEKEPETLYVSHGRLCCNPQSSEGILTISPRVDSLAIYYRLVAIDIAKRKMLDSVVLPKSMAASEAVYQNGMFTFCIEQTYDYGEAIGTFGTYLVRNPTDLVQLYRVPTTTPAWSGEWLMVKSTQSVLGINPTKRHYFVIDAPVGCANYGDFLATAGKADRIVTYTTISSEKGDGSGVTRVRVFETYEDTHDPTPKGAGASLDEQKAAEEISTVQE